jgi:hypothetical protein
VRRRGRSCALGEIRVEVLAREAERHRDARHRDQRSREAGAGEIYLHTRTERVVNRRRVGAVTSPARIAREYRMRRRP